jgi:hypothetical protein
LFLIEDGKMNKRPKTLIGTTKLEQFFLLVVSLFSLLFYFSPVQAQTPTPYDELVKAIQERAQQDVKLGKPAEGIEGLNILFGEQAKTAGISMPEVLNIYEEAYAAATPPKSWTDSLKPEYGWLVAALLFALFILRDIIKDILTKFFGWAGKNVYRHVAGFRPFWWLALRRYRRALVKKYEELNIPFRPGRPLKMHEVYVPIKVAGTSDADLLDARQAMLKYQWLIVVGAPGSGKSMLLKNLALTYAQGELVDFPTQPIPIFLELNRLNESNVQLRDHLVEILDQNDFPNAGNFLEVGLVNGLLMLMFDGLDEVNSDLRESVVNKIKDLLAKYQNCRAVVTCRSAVYNDEFADLADQKLEIVEFSDQQIQRFLISWAPDMPLDKSVENLLRNLRERPRIMALARNPLLLTIIAYLYTDTEFVLPHSRAEFYDKSVTVLLEQWKEKRNKYKAAHKKLVLQHLALFNQDGSVGAGQDRRSIELPTLLAEVKKVLPSLTLKDDDAQSILDEIVERSGLMIEIDGGTKYQFTHLTLQEFFAALALEADVIGLVKRYETNNDAWRETVKLWCGLTHNSTQLIRSVYTKDPIMAFECLGDAQQVDADFSEEISNTFKTRLGEFGDSGEAIIRAFAVVSADPRPRGQNLFDFLVTALNDKNISEEQRLAITRALSLTNLPSAAEILAKYAIAQPEIRPLLIQMGDLAVPILEKWIGEENEWVLDALHTIGTPQAAQVFVSLLWGKTETLQFQSAWRLSSLLSRPNVEMTLSQFTLTTEERNSDQLNWVWEPFEESATSPLRIIVGRIAYLIQTAPEDTILPDPIIAPDSRMVIPLCAIAAKKEKLNKLTPAEYEELKKEIDEIVSSDTIPVGRSTVLEQKQRELVSTVLEKICVDQIWFRMFEKLDLTRQIKLLTTLVQRETIPTIDDWRNIFHPVKYEFSSSWQAKIIKLTLTLFLFVGLWRSVNTIISKTQFWSSENIIPILLSIIFVVLVLSIWLGRFNLDVVYGILIFSGISLGFTTAIFYEVYQGMFVGKIRDIIENYLGSTEISLYYYLLLQIIFFSIVYAILFIFDDNALGIPFLEKITKNTNLPTTQRFAYKLSIGLIMGIVAGVLVGLSFGGLSYGSIWLLSLMFGVNITVITLVIEIILSIALFAIFFGFFMMALSITETKSSSNQRSFIVFTGTIIIQIIVGTAIGVIIGAILTILVVLLSPITSIVFYSIVYFQTVYIIEVWGWEITLVFWLIFFVLLITLTVQSVQLQRKAKNPLQRLLTEENTNNVLEPVKLFPLIGYLHKLQKWLKKIIL